MYRENVSGTRTDLPVLYEIILCKKKRTQLIIGIFFFNTSRNLLDAAGFWLGQSKCQEAALQLTCLGSELANTLGKAL